MQEHQRASALPYLEVWLNTASDKYEIILYNNGVGPAFIKESELTYIDSVYKFHYGQLIDSLDDSIGTTSSTIAKGRVIPPREEQLLLGVYNEEQIKRLRKLLPEIKFKIKYASVFGEKWEINELGRPPIKLE